jgi:formyltetrahydrofolate deformylase
VPEYVLTLRCSDTAGIVHAVAAGLLDSQANILEQAQFTDPDLNLFCVRTRFETLEESPANVLASVTASTERFGPSITLRRAAARRRVLVMVSKFDHCLVDLLYRCQIGELPVDIVAVVSNHPDLRGVAERANVPFLHISADGRSKQDAERELEGVITGTRAEAVVLARYMQILSDEFCSRLSGQIINIHHSFLPGFKGARPYHQAHERGVKLIGATAHFVTADLDEGPIIEQDVQRVTHAQTADDLVEIGRDVERRVLSRAVRLWAEDRVLLVGARTIVFS